jgi:hypothetical protein
MSLIMFTKVTSLNCSPIGLDKFSPNTKTVLLGSLMKVGESWVYRVINKTFPVGRVCSENQVVKIISHELS